MEVLAFIPPGSLSPTHSDGTLLFLKELMHLSSSMSSILTRQDFTDTLAKPLQEGEGNPTPAGLNEEGANLLMLQTRQALGTLSMAFSSLETQGALRILANTANAPMTGSEQAEEEEANGKKLWDFSL